MRQPRIVTTLPVTLALVISLRAPAAEKPDASWEKLKSLAGEWTAVVEGKPTTASYKVVSNGTALMETIDAPDHMQMITMYHPDGDALLMTHYCSIGNQPRMRAKGMESGKLDFRYVDASNVKGPDEPRMSHLVMSFPDADHLDEQWTYKAGATEKTETFHYTKKK
jgi:hypothetical protein